MSVFYDSVRYRSIKSYLERGDSTTITLYISKPTAPKNDKAKPHFEVKFGLKEEYMDEKLEEKRAEE